MRRLFYPGLITLGLLLSSCGGGGGGGGGGSTQPTPPANNSPVFTSGTSQTTPENISTTSYVAVATDEDGDSISYSISGGDDNELFTIGVSSGKLDFVSAPDFEAPADLDADNDYSVDITADDGRGGTAAISVVITVSNKNFLITYPTPNANLGGSATQSTIRGRVVDELSSFEGIEINGVQATIDSTDPSLFSIQTTVSQGTNVLRANMQSPQEAVTESTFALTNEASISKPFDVAYLDDETALVLEAFSGNLLSVNIETGESVQVSGNLKGNGPTLRNPWGMHYDEVRNRALVVDRGADAVLSVDLVTGNRTVVSNATIGTGDAFESPNRIAYDPAGDRAFVIDTSAQALFEVDLANGNRQSVGAASGSNFINLIDISYDAANNRLLGVVFNPPALVSIDLDTGITEIISDNNLNFETDFLGPAELIYDESLNRVLLIDRESFQDQSQRRLLEVDLSTGSRAIVSNAVTGSGRNFEDPRGLAFSQSGDLILIGDFDLDTIMEISLPSGDRRIAPLQFTVGNGVELTGLTDVIYDPTRNRALVLLNNELPGVVSVDLSSGDRSVLFNNSLGSGDRLETPTAFALIPEEDRMLILDVGLDALVSVDLDTRTRTIFSGEGVGSGVEFEFPIAIAIDSNGDRALVVDNSNATLIGVDLQSGDRTLLSGSGLGSGVPLDRPTGLTFDALNNRALVSDLNQKALISIDLVTGDRESLSSGISRPADIAYDPAMGQAYLVNDGRLLKVNAATGARQVFASESVGSGASLSNPRGIDIDIENGRILVADSILSAILVIDQPTGERAVSSR